MATMFGPGNRPWRDRASVSVSSPVVVAACLVDGLTVDWYGSSPSPSPPLI